MTTVYAQIFSGDTIEVSFDSSSKRLVDVLYLQNPDLFPIHHTINLDEDDEKMCKKGDIFRIFINTVSEENETVIFKEISDRFFHITIEFNTLLSRVIPMVSFGYSSYRFIVYFDKNTHKIYNKLPHPRHQRPDVYESMNEYLDTFGFTYHAKKNILHKFETCLKDFKI